MAIVNEGMPAVTPPHPPIRVLLVDDARELRELIARVLRQDGTFEIVGMADDGAQGADLAGELLPDVVLLDLAMPGVDGLHALPLLRAASPLSKIVVLSGFQRAPLAATVLEGGAVGYLEKGAPPERLRIDLLLVLGALHQLDELTRSVDLPAEAASVRNARRFVSAALLELGCGELLSTAMLLTSELVSNAVQHAQGTPQVVVQALPSHLRVEVHDQSDERPRLREPGADGGRGLRLVEELAWLWGVEPRPGGKAVWFALRRPEAEGTTPPV